MSGEIDKSKKSEIEKVKGLRSVEAKRCSELSKCRYCPFQLHCQRGGIYIKSAKLLKYPYYIYILSNI